MRKIQRPKKYYKIKIKKVSKIKIASIPGFARLIICYWLLYCTYFVLCTRALNFLALLLAISV